MNRYVEYKKRKQAEFDKLPMKAAFGYPHSWWWGYSISL